MAIEHEDQAEVRRVLDRFIETWNRHDVQAFASLFAEDADFTNVGGVQATGRTRIEHLHAPVFETAFAASEQRLLRTKFRPLTSDVIAADAWWSMIGAKDASGDPRPIRYGLASLVLTRGSEGWEIAVMHNMELGGPPVDAEGSRPAE